MLYGRLLDKNAHSCEPLTDFSDPVVLLQGRKSGGDRLIECLSSNVDRVLHIANILYRYCARPQNHYDRLTYSPFVRYYKQEWRLYRSRPVSERQFAILKR